MRNPCNRCQKKVCEEYNHPCASYKQWFVKEWDKTVKRIKYYTDPKRWKHEFWQYEIKERGKIHE